MNTNRTTALTGLLLSIALLFTMGPGCDNVKELVESAQQHADETKDDIQGTIILTKSFDQCIDACHDKYIEDLVGLFRNTARSTLCMDTCRNEHPEETNSLGKIFKLLDAKVKDFDIDDYCYAFQADNVLVCKNQYIPLTSEDANFIHKVWFDTACKDTIAFPSKMAVLAPKVLAAFLVTLSGGTPDTSILTAEEKEILEGRLSCIEYFSLAYTPNKSYSRKLGCTDPTVSELVMFENVTGDSLNETSKIINRGSVICKHYFDESKYGYNDVKYYNKNETQIDFTCSTPPCDLVNQNVHFIKICSKSTDVCSKYDINGDFENVICPFIGSQSTYDVPCGTIQYTYLPKAQTYPGANNSPYYKACKKILDDKTCKF